MWGDPHPVLPQVLRTSDPLCEQGSDGRHQTGRLCHTSPCFWEKGILRPTLQPLKTETKAPEAVLHSFPCSPRFCQFSPSSHLSHCPAWSGQKQLCLSYKATERVLNSSSDKCFCPGLTSGPLGLSMVPTRDPIKTSGRYRVENEIPLQPLPSKVQPKL